DIEAAFARRRSTVEAVHAGPQAVGEVVVQGAAAAVGIGEVRGRERPRDAGEGGRALGPGPDADRGRVLGPREVLDLLSPGGRRDDPLAYRGREGDHVRGRSHAVCHVVDVEPPDLRGAGGEV